MVLKRFSMPINSSEPSITVASLPRRWHFPLLYSDYYAAHLKWVLVVNKLVRKRDTRDFGACKIKMCGQYGTQNTNKI